MTDPINFTQELLARRESSLLCDETNPAQRSDLLQVVETLCFATTILRYCPSEALEYLLDIKSKSNHPDSKRDLQRIIDMFEPKSRPRAASIQKANVHKTKDTTFDVIEQLLSSCINESNILIVFDWDETLASSYDNAWQQLESMVDGMTDKLRTQLKDMINRTIHSSNLTNESGIIVPSNIDHIRHLNDLPNVMVKIVTKRNPEGVEEVINILRQLHIHGIEVIGTIQIDGSNVEKSRIISTLAQVLKSDIVHFVDDSKPHIEALESLYSNLESGVTDVYCHSVDLKAQILTPVVSHLMSVFS